MFCNLSCRKKVIQTIWEQMYRKGRMHVNILWSLNFQQQTTWLLIHSARSRFFLLISHHGLSTDSGSRKTELILTAIQTTEKFVCLFYFTKFWGLPWWLSGKMVLLNAGDVGSIPGKIPWRRKWKPTPVFLPGESYRQGNLAIEITESQNFLVWVVLIPLFSE